ncbi:olfactory receptor 226-like [Trichechus manatus latirostris]|uniref:Olfactory receptor n=1 Tax=Trichechus manatus latirostris TaxID=127582 RepID=A0A2Y9QQE7_TRIMA|nr:olfactory receptor 226-like [Trichechus manatus latirostris]
MSARDNGSEVIEFILLGFSGSQGLHLSLLVLFLLAYMLTVTENVVVMAVICTSPLLHKPMYLFLSHLSFLETWYISVTVPKMLLSLVAPKFRRISFAGCMAQLYFFLALACTECVLLSVMAYDRYVAICSPLRYPTIMHPGLCSLLATGSWLSGFSISLGKVFFISRLGYCGPNIMNHFFCDVSPLLNLACSDMSVAELVDFVLALLILLGPLLLTVSSYVKILSAVLRIPSSTGRHKAFSTCASHLAVVVIFYSASLFTYARPRAVYSFDYNKLVSVVYTVLTPLVNPIIYCLHNQEVKTALRRVAQKVAQALGAST